jgi:hypothetical protein
MGVAVESFGAAVSHPEGVNLRIKSGSTRVQHHLLVIPAQEYSCRTRCSQVEEKVDDLPGIGTPINVIPHEDEEVFFIERKLCNQVDESPIFAMDVSYCEDRAGHEARY